MKPITFSKESRAEIVGRIQRYFREELDQEIGAIPAELLLGFFTETIGGYYYNSGSGRRAGGVRQIAGRDQRQDLRPGAARDAFEIVGG